MRDVEKVLRMTETEGWQVVQRFLTQQIEVCTRRLTEENFADLADVARLQGEITGYRRLLSFVNNRCKKITNSKEV